MLLLLQSFLVVTAYCYPFQPTEECGLRVFGSPSRKRNLFRFRPPAFLLFWRSIHFLSFSLSFSYSFLYLPLFYSRTLSLSFSLTCSFILVLSSVSFRSLFFLLEFDFMWFDIQPTHFYAHFLPILPREIQLNIQCFGCRNSLKLLLLTLAHIISKPRRQNL